MTNANHISILGSGWLGLPLAQSLKNRDDKVCLSTRSLKKAKQFNEQGFQAYIIDIEKKSIQFQDFLNAHTLIINITSKDYLAFQSLVLAIEKSPIKHVLFVSSTSVYGNDKGLCKESDLLTEETNLRQIEKLFTNNIHFNCTVIRFAGLIGRKRHPGRFFAAGKSIKDGHAKVNLIHQLDCIELIKTVIDQGAWGEIFNGCADNHPAKGDYYTSMGRSLGYPEPACLWPENSSSKIICNEKVKKQLGYQFIYPDIYKIHC